MSLAQRIRDFRYSKGWGPDELANRAEISRTALYQIESGKTEVPRAGTLLRIAVALDIPMDELPRQQPRDRNPPAGRRPGADFPARTEPDRIGRLGRVSRTVPGRHVLRAP